MEKNCISCIKVWKSNFWKCQFFFDTVSSLSQPVVSQISSIQTKKKTWQTINCTDVSAAENQRRVDSQLKLWWWCSLRIDQGVYHLLNASILWGTLSGVWIKEKVSKKCVEQPPKKNVTGILVASCGCFLQISYVFLRTLFVCHQKNKTTLMIDAFPKKNTTFLWGGEAFSCLPHHQHRDSSAFF